jgi:hypothetical protein
MPINNWSPTRWPMLSLISLKRSRSKKSMANSRSGFFFAPVERHLQLLHKPGAVRQPGERVVISVVHQLLLGALAVGDVLYLKDQMRLLILRVASSETPTSTQTS